MCYVLVLEARRRARAPKHLNQGHVLAHNNTHIFIPAQQLIMAPTPQKKCMTFFGTVKQMESTVDLQFLTFFLDFGFLRRSNMEACCWVAFWSH